MNINVRDLLDAGVHFGHQVRRWNPRSKPFIHGHIHGISIIDLEKTYEQLEIATKYVEDTVAKGKEILFVGTKKQAKDVIREAATNVGMPFSVNRWMGGTLTNFVTIKSSLAKYHKFLEMEADGRLSKLPGKEAAAIRRQMERMFRNFEGLKTVKELPAALFVIDIKSEQIAVAEAVQAGLARRELNVAQKGFTPVVREENFESGHEAGVTLPEGYEEFGDASATPAPEAVEEVVEEAPVAEEPVVEAAPEAVAEEAPAEEEKPAKKEETSEEK